MRHVPQSLDWIREAKNMELKANVTFDDFEKAKRPEALRYVFDSQKLKVVVGPGYPPKSWTTGDALPKCFPVESSRKNAF